MNALGTDVGQLGAPNAAAPPEDQPLEHGAPQQIPHQDAPPPVADEAFPQVEYIRLRLEEAERLLGHAADSGVQVEDTVRGHVFTARMAEQAGHWTRQIAEDLLQALTILAKQLWPVTAESLRLCATEEDTDRISKSYKRVAIVLACLIVPFSLTTFVTSGISKSMQANLTRANALAVTLTNELRLPAHTPEGTTPAAPPAQQPSSAAAAKPAAAAASTDQTTALATGLPPGISYMDVTQHLQEFAALTREIYADGRHLNVFVLWVIREPPDAQKDLELDPTPFLSPTQTSFQAITIERIRLYQGARFFAQAVDNVVSIFYNACAACILPVLYALLGACAYLLREFAVQVRMKTLSDPDTHLARFLIAAIAGAVIGLFNNFKLGDGASVSPLAIAFLVGYAVDVFFTFVETLTRPFNRESNPAAPQPNANGRPPS